MYIRTYQQKSQSSPQLNKIRDKNKNNEGSNDSISINVHKFNRNFYPFRNKIFLTKGIGNSKINDQQPLQKQYLQKQHQTARQRIKAGYRNIRLRGSKRSTNIEKKKQQNKNQILVNVYKNQIQSSLKKLKPQNQNKKSMKDSNVQKVVIQGKKVSNKGFDLSTSKVDSDKNSQKNKHKKTQKLVLDLSVRDAPQKQYFKNQEAISQKYPLNYTLFKKFIKKNQQQSQQPQIIKQYRRLTTSHRSRNPLEQSKILKRKTSAHHKSFDAFQSKRLNQFINPWIVDSHDDQQYF